MRFACWVTKATHTHTIYYCFSTASVGTRTRLNVTLYLLCLSCVFKNEPCTCPKPAWLQTKLYYILASLSTSVWQQTMRSYTRFTLPRVPVWLCLSTVNPDEWWKWNLDPVQRNIVILWQRTTSFHAIQKFACIIALQWHQTSSLFISFIFIQNSNTMYNSVQGHLNRHNTGIVTMWQARQSRFDSREGNDTGCISELSRSSVKSTQPQCSRGTTSSFPGDKAARWWR
jgi:hypothetical protein